MGNEFEFRDEREAEGAWFYAGQTEAKIMLLFVLEQSNPELE